MSAGRLLKQAAGALLPRRILYRGSRRLPPRVALTFDDGPSAAHTAAVIAALGEAGARATFFLQGANAEREPGLVRALAQAGHEIANHGWSHARPGEIGTAAYVAEALATHELLERIVGRALPRLYRPAYGSLGPATFAALLREGFRIAFWSVDSRDSFVRDPRLLAEAMIASAIRPGDVLLFHDDAAHTPAALPDIVAALRRKGFGFAGVSEI